MTRFTPTILVCLSGCFLATQLCAGQPAGAAGQANAEAPLSARERQLLERIAHLEERVEALEQKLATGKPTPPPPSEPETAQPAVQSALAAVAEPKSSEVLPPPSFLGGTTLNVYLDTYYGYNFNNPIGRVNLLRAYDVSSNAFSLNQADLILDNEPDVPKGKRWGFRLDLQYGQATQSQQGNPANEPRPDIYRDVYQAYGTYVLPIGKNLSVDFGKFASSIGFEGNYTKDQINYSRSLLFTALPFYHMGARFNYKVSDAFTVSYWLVNGIQQAEPFNGYKDELFGFAFTPNSSISWNVNYYLGQEHPDVTYFPNGGAPANAPTLQGVPFEPIANAPTGKLHIFDTYVSWQTTPKLRLAAEADDEIERLYGSSAPSHFDGGALYLQYQLTPKLSLGARGEYLSDRGGLFTGTTQAVKETTFTTKYQLVDGFDVFGEWRRDFSNEPFFYTNTLGVLKKEQNTATLGLVWWWGGKTGAW